MSKKSGTREAQNTESMNISFIQPIMAKTKPIIDLDRFKLRDVDLDGYPMDQKELEGIVKQLVTKGAIRRADRYMTSKDVYVWIYEWDETAKERIKHTLEQFNQLPCGCRAHVSPNMTPEGDYICKFCGEVHSESEVIGSFE